VSANTAAIAGFARKLQSAGQGVSNSQHTGLALAAAVARGALEAAPGAPRGTVAGKPVSVIDKVLGDTAYVRWKGPVHLVNNPTKSHLIQPKQFVGTRGTGKRAQKGAAFLAAFGIDAHSGRGGVVLADGGIRTAVMHPGTKGKHFFQAGAPAALKLAAQVYGRHFKLELAKHFGGS
jgi:hypothetical protein